jgi:hypothetical protein
MSIGPRRWCDIQEFQHRKLVVHSLDDLFQAQNRYNNAYASHAIAVLEGKHDPSFIFGSKVVIIVIVKNDKWKGRGMSEHFCHGSAR